MPASDSVRKLLELHGKIPLSLLGGGAIGYSVADEDNKLKGTAVGALAGLAPTLVETLARNKMMVNQYLPSMAKLDKGYKAQRNIHNLTDRQKAFDTMFDKYTVDKIVDELHPRQAKLFGKNKELLFKYIENLVNSKADKLNAWAKQYENKKILPRQLLMASPLFIPSALLASYLSKDEPSTVDKLKKYLPK